MIPQSSEIQKRILQEELDSVDENLEVLMQQGKTFQWCAKRRGEAQDQTRNEDQRTYLRHRKSQR